MRATQGQLIAANATGCLEVFSTPYPETSWQLPWIHSLFGNAAAVGTGIAAALLATVRAGGKAAFARLTEEQRRVIKMERAKLNKRRTRAIERAYVGDLRDRIRF